MDMAIAMISPRVGLFDMAFSILATDLLTRILENKPRNAASGVRDRLGDNHTSIRRPIANLAHRAEECATSFSTQE
ncbi:unnamed protein product [Clonostachys rosea f. rosea IK726]|uniref:Uncharacterized protein n=1 Tax=Clonostachys rosea f. rosea IK726 TaxID=1349383 RepID=A0ACA9UF63_BIOOC|nr:unnamed protein product [Clonostachys rosea f. rosea IK726]